MAQIPELAQPNSTEPYKILFAAKDIDVTEWKGDILLVGVTVKDLWKDESLKFESQILKKLDACLGGILGQVSSEEDFSGKPGQSTVHRISGLGSKQVGLVGLGHYASSPGAFHVLGEAVASASKAFQSTSVAIVLASPETVLDEYKHSYASAIASGIVLGFFGYSKYKSESKKPSLKSVDIIGFGTGLELETMLNSAEYFSYGVISKFINSPSDEQIPDFKIEIINSHSNVLTPVELPEEATNLASTSSDHRGNKRSKTLINPRENLDPIPLYLFLEIFSRLPAKSITRWRFLSKLWASMLHRPEFTDLFLANSSVHPQILFACQKKGSSEVVFFSSPQLQNPGLEAPPLPTNRLAHFPLSDSHQIFSPIRGLVCFIDERAGDETAHLQVICNPSTGQSLALPKMYTMRGRMMSYFGYDPVDKQLKVLSMTWRNGNEFEEHQVLTLGTGNDTWRKIKCFIHHYSSSKGICINGVVYYHAIHKSTETNLIVCFDVKSETFRFITMIDETLVKAVSDGTLIDCNGKLGLLQPHGRFRAYVDDESTGFTLWILDQITQEWSPDHIYEFPANLLEIVGKAMLRFEGMTKTNEVVFSSFLLSNLFYLYYYNIDKRTFRRVQIQGMDEFLTRHTFLHHVEDVKLM